MDDYKLLDEADHSYCRPLGTAVWLAIEVRTFRQDGFRTNFEPWNKALLPVEFRNKQIQILSRSSPKLSHTIIFVGSPDRAAPLPVKVMCAN